MQLLCYAWVVLCGFGIGWGLGAESWSWLVVPSLAAAALGCWMLPRVGPVQVAASGLSPAHRAWFCSSAACMVVLLWVWLAFGWSLPSLSLDGVRLDPAGALGWDNQWLMQRLAVVQWLMFAGLVGVAVALARWALQKRRGKVPRVVLGWVFAPFFWMMSLGLLMGVSQPWRQAPSHEMALRWKPGTSPSTTASLADAAIKQARSDGVAAVWAHALGLKAYQQGQWDRARLDGFMGRLAGINANRQRSWWFAASSAVGVEGRDWCLAEVARTQQAKVNWAAAQARCAQTPPGRLWSWRSR